MMMMMMSAATKDGLVLWNIHIFLPTIFSNILHIMPQLPMSEPAHCSSMRHQQITFVNFLCIIYAKRNIHVCTVYLLNRNFWPQDIVRAKQTSRESKEDISSKKVSLIYAQLCELQTVARSLKRHSPLQRSRQKYFQFKSKFSFSGSAHSLLSYVDFFSLTFFSCHTNIRCCWHSNIACPTSLLSLS